ncbi:hypothetical protein [Marinicellulosiphila megalodicopiae]|uniref:hypothetical protein n=1 Tax=Marinicellulosiphila megalodicopiae TaxID=2724896 RepID=UPI003BAFDC86
MKARTVSLIVLFIFSIISSCTCPTYFTIINGFRIFEINKSTGQSYQPQNTINFNDLELNLFIDYATEETTSFNWSRLSLIQPAYASADCGGMFVTNPSELITKIEIFSNSNFNENSPQGTNLIDNFQLLYGAERIGFRLHVAPAEKSSSHVFNFKVYVEDGSFYEVFTNPINFEVE